MSRTFPDVSAVRFARGVRGAEGHQVTWDWTCLQKNVPEECDAGLVHHPVPGDYQARHSLDITAGADGQQGLTGLSVPTDGL